MKRVIALTAAAVLLLSAAALAGEEKKHADLSFTVLKDYNGKPVRNASVILHQVDKRGKQESGGVQLKTDPDGKANYNSVPYGKLRIQVIAPGFQTFGEDYDISQPSHDIVIKLQRPKDQYSIYK